MTKWISEGRNNIQCMKICFMILKKLREGRAWREIIDILGLFNVLVLKDRQ